MNGDIFKNLKDLNVSSQVKFVNPMDEQMKRITKLHNDQMKAVQEAQKRKNDYDQEVLQTLKEIKHNTAGLSEVISLLAKNNDNQEKIAEYLKEAIDIAASQTQEEAESKWRKVMNRATDVTTDVETIQKLHGFANTIMALFQNIPG
ncbi:hypothetical protein V7127_02655 [Bacillus sp. JJ1773]|uniref:hypothetical protein n=1 Tax=Bacillus sp. JJ1773 TaxID=3122965 RepID=UPI002FFDDB9A